MTDQLTPEAVKAALDGAAPGPWRVMSGKHSFQIHSDRFWLANIKCEACPVHEDDTARLIALAPDLAREYLRLKEVEKAGKALAEQFNAALDELNEYNITLSREGYNCPAHNLALTDFRAAVEGK